MGFLDLFRTNPTKKLARIAHVGNQLIRARNAKEREAVAVGTFNKAKSAVASKKKAYADLKRKINPFSKKTKKTKTKK